MDKSSDIRKFVIYIVSMAHIPPDRLKEAYIILKDFKFEDNEECKFKEEMLKYLNQQWLNNRNMPVHRWNVFKRKANLTNNAQEAFNGRLKKKIKIHNPNPYLLQGFLKDEFFNSKNKITEYELGITSKRKNKAQERIDSRRQKCKIRLKNDPSYKLESYMLAIGSCSVKADFGLKGQQFNHIENESNYQTILVTPLNIRKERNKNKRKSRQRNVQRGRDSELILPTDSESESNLTCVLPEPVTPRLRTNNARKEKVTCNICAKGFNIRSHFVVCSKCENRFHVKCISWAYDEDNFLCREHEVEEVILELNLDVVQPVVQPGN